MSRVVVVTDDTVAEKMAGPAIRAWQIASHLAIENEVRLVSTSSQAPTRQTSSFETSRGHTAKQLRTHMAWCEVLIFQGTLLSRHSWIIDLPIKIVVDLYAPMLLEQLEQGRHDSHTGRAASESWLHINDSLNTQLRRGDFFICASDRQRDFWLGQLAGNGRLNSHTYNADPLLQNLIAVVPFGIEDAPPEPDPSYLRQLVPGLQEDDEVIVWGGGIYNWLDPLVTISAMPAILEVVPNAKLVFMGGAHPNPHVPKMRMAAQAVALATELSLLNTHVFFNEAWVPYDQRGRFLSGATIGISTHKNHLETSFSFRTRLLDYLWVGIPIVTTGGDVLANDIERFRLGVTVPSDSSDLVAEAVISLLAQPKLREACAKNIVEYRSQLEWRNALKPLSAYCASPTHASDWKPVDSDQHREQVQERAAYVLVDVIDYANALKKELNIALLVIEEIVEGRFWRLTNPFRNSYLRIRSAMHLNPSGEIVDAYLNSLTDDVKPTRRGLNAFARSIVRSEKSDRSDGS